MVEPGPLDENINQLLPSFRILHEFGPLAETQTGAWCRTGPSHQAGRSKASCPGPQCRSARTVSLFEKYPEDNPRYVRCIKLAVSGWTCTLTQPEPYNLKTKAPKRASLGREAAGTSFASHGWDAFFSHLVWQPTSQIGERY